MIFYFRLTRELGGMTVSHLLREIPSREISGWMAFLILEDELEKRKKARESEKSLKAHIDMMSRQAEKRKKKKEKYHRRKTMQGVKDENK